MQVRVVTVSKPLVFFLCLLPILALVWRWYQHQLGANPLELIIRSLGEWGLLLLLITLTMTPLRDALGKSWPIQYRRMLGLFSFFYVCLHLTTYLWVDQFFDWDEIGHDILKRPFITVGMLAFILLVPLAVTSTRRMQRWLGKNWLRLHKLVYGIVVLAVLHFFWLVKADITRPLYLAIAAGTLLLYRLYRHWAKASPHTAPRRVVESFADRPR
jgi:sulfoxide reductase heme-binding subunit YedZ